MCGINSFTGCGISSRRTLILHITQTTHIYVCIKGKPDEKNTHKVIREEKSYTQSNS